uniref:Ig-like domain-containing protein n=1 Tax=Nothobranchius furzeri TaxID=105023 RepID=A0A8C6KDJ5_NOTFU
MLWTLCSVIAALTSTVLTQTPAVHTVSTGQQVVLYCNVQRDDVQYVFWYKQVSGGTPQYVLKFYHTHDLPSFGSGFSADQFSSKATSNIDYQFIIKQTEAADSAVYHCSTWDTSAEEWLFVTDSSLPPPVLTVFPPSSSELQSNTASLVCVSRQSGPFSDVTWLVGGSPVSGGISSSSAVQRPEQTFHISSSLSIQTSDWDMNQVYTCKVSLGSQSAEKTISKSGCPAGE